MIDNLPRAATRSASLSRWFTRHGRDLPWRTRTPSWRPTGPAGAWGVLVSEVMLQQTPVERVVPAWRMWLGRWPTPADLAAASPADAIRAWDRLGYPRRAIRLHSAAVAIRERHGGRVPKTRAELLDLPGVGDYTAGAVLAFAFGRAEPTLDTNVRRVLARHDDGRAYPADQVTLGERGRVVDDLPPGRRGAAWMAGLMELGALVCRSTSPHCDACPLATSCRWRALGYPPAPARRRTQAAYQGSDRQARGAVLAAVRSHEGPLAVGGLDAHWPDQDQRERAVAGLLEDGLIVWTNAGLALPE